MGQSAPGFFLTSDDFPDRFTHGPSLGGHGGIRFAFVVRREPEHSLARRERARPCTIGTFNQRNATVEKTLEFDGNHPRKRAFGCFDCLHLFSHCYYRFRRVLLPVGRHSFLLWFSLAPIPLLCGLRWRGFDAWSCSINNPKRITTQHKE